MANLWMTLNQKWVVLSKRDRMMLFMVGMFAVLGLTDTYLTDPVRQQARLTEEELLKMQQDTAKVQQQIVLLKAGATAENNPLQKEINQVKADIAAQEKVLLNVGSMMVAPQQITGVMKKLLTRHSDVQVVTMESLPPESFVKKHVAETASTVVESNTSAVDVGMLYQHSIRLKLSGSYLALLNYVSDLKALGNTIAWESAELSAKYPHTELTVEMYTLSPEKAWLGI